MCRYVRSAPEFGVWSRSTERSDQRTFSGVIVSMMSVAVDDVILEVERLTGPHRVAARAERSITGGMCGMLRKRVKTRTTDPRAGPTD